MRATGAVALGAVLAIGASACGDSGGGSGDKDSVTIGFMGDLTGEASGIVIPPSKGAQMAIDEYNATNPKIKIKFKTYDSQGKGEQAVPLAKTAIQKDKIVGLVGPAFSGETQQVGPVMEEGKVPMISASATNSALSANGWKFFHRIVGNDDVQGAGIGTFITNGLGAKKVFVIHDNSEYGKPLGTTVEGTVKGKGATTQVSAIDPEASDYSATVNQAKAFKPDAIFFGGYYAAGGKLIKQLREAGVTARFLSGDGSLDKGLAKGAGGKNADGSVIGCPCLIDPTGKASPASKKFSEAYKAKYNSDTAIYSAEGYDAATAFITAIKAGKTKPEEINDFLKTIDVPGVSKQIKFTDKGDPASSAIYVYQVTGDTLPLIGDANTAKLSD
ncbi:branched-chain amino acid ABC transporter substrate-binding protein [Actinomadura atramentaria]|uniref:branched-chain amino acid ABC transporter substrate-binding protein n=1 Tax=Actinomadura atramentaria TaxID=1990 RepID=UPI0004780DAA|nr:branched-chain amino acid ABC transporter substrate-binding protein [Actinomadura atramentaria]